METGTDRFFEEQRTYRSYPSLRRVKAIRTRAACGTAGGVVICLVALSGR